MRYFQCPARARQVILHLTVFFALSVPAQTFAQEEKTIENGITETNILTTEKVVAAAEARLKKVAPRFNREAFTAKTFVKPFEPENQKIRDFPFSFKTENKRQSQPDDDDTMMGAGGEKSRFGGHVGFVVPIVGRGGGVTTNVGDRFVFGFPVGLTVKTKKNVAIDFEFIPTFNTGRDFVLTIHPGIIYGFKKKYAVGVRAAYDAGAGSYGFTPLVSRGFKINEKVGFFIEADFPIRSNYRPFQDRFGSIAFATHAGFAF